MSAKSDVTVAIIGAGPAGLTAAYQLSKAGIAAIVLEKDSLVGGLSRTVEYKGYRFDIGGHRFFTKIQAVEEMWREVLSDGSFLRRRRMSRILYEKKFFKYPLAPYNALFGLGVWNSVLVLASYAYAQLFPAKPEKTLEDWVSNRFGRRLYRIFFKTYTEKVWGIACSKITAEWAAQRIRGLSLLTAVKNALLRSQSKSNGEVIKTLINSFHYPEKGPGMMWERVADIVADSGCEVRLRARVNKVLWNGKDRVLAVASEGSPEPVTGTHFLSTMPIRTLIGQFDPPAPKAVQQAAQMLNYRDFLTVALIVEQADVFPDNWIYVHDPSVQVGRIQNFKNWSPRMVPDPDKTCLGLEYFCFEDDGLWSQSDDELLELARRELDQLGLLKGARVEDGAVVRVPKAYPVYDPTYKEALEVIRDFLRPIENLQLIGRNGMHKYNNQDHSMLTAMLAVENILGANHDLWEINADDDYQEEVRRSDRLAKPEIELLRSTQPRVPVRTKDTGEPALSERNPLKRS